MEKKIIIKKIDVRKEGWTVRCNHTKAFIYFKNEKKYFGEVPENEQEQKRYYEHIVRTEREQLEKALKSKKIGYEKITFSLKCGCSCGCSPGFIVTGTKEPMCIWIDLTVA